MQRLCLIHELLQHKECIEAQIVFYMSKIMHPKTCIKYLTTTCNKGDVYTVK